MIQCTCLLNHVNGGVCTCQDNSDWDNYDNDETTYTEDTEEDDQQEDYTKITKKDDDWYVQ